MNANIRDDLWAIHDDGHENAQKGNEEAQIRCITEGTAMISTVH